VASTFNIPATQPKRIRQASIKNNFLGSESQPRFGPCCNSTAESWVAAGRIFCPSVARHSLTPSTTIWGNIKRELIDAGTQRVRKRRSRAKVAVFLRQYSSALALSRGSIKGAPTCSVRRMAVTRYRYKSFASRQSGSLADGDPPRSVFGEMMQSPATALLLEASRHESI